jgi:Mn2+/Fe2+ NRAMP family transporter
VIMLISNNQKIMGKRVNNRWLNGLGWLTTALMFFAAAALVASWI